MSGRYPSREQTRIWNECLRKRLYKTEAEAAQIYESYHHSDPALHVYACPRADHFHIGHVNKRALEIVH